MAGEDSELIAEKAKLEAKRARFVAAITELGSGATQQPHRDKIQEQAGIARDRIKAINIELHRRAKERADSKRGVPPVAALEPLRDRMRQGCEELVEMIDASPKAIAGSLKTLRKKLLETAAELEKQTWED